MSIKMDLSKVLGLAAASVLGLAVAGAASAQDSPLSPTTPPEMSPGPSADYSKLDADKDGSISKVEARKNKDLVRQWDSLDINKDGKLDEGEFAQFEVETPSSPAKPDAQ